jgi:hypothetical protein
MNGRDATPAEEIMATTRAIVESVVDAEDEMLLDDNELIPVLRRIIQGMTRRLEAMGVGYEEVVASADAAMEVAREAYVALWIRQSYEIDDGPVDEAAERRAALRAFALAERGGR